MKLLLIFLGVLLYFSKYLEGVRFRCEYKYTNLGWFKYHIIPANWSNASLQCQLEGGVLASPISADIKSILKEYACKLDIFTGIHATFSTGQYYSVEGIPLAKIPHEWAEYEPDNKNDAESCLTLDLSGKLSDVSCDEPRPYVCYRKHSDIDVNVCGTPDPEYHFDSRTNKCYKFHTKSQTYERAHFACSAEGGHLAIINSDTEFLVLREVFAKYPAGKIIGYVWKDGAFVGIYNGYDWRTIHGQTLEEAGFATFSPGEPNNYFKPENCGLVGRNGLYYDGQCGQEFPFICEKEPDYPAVCENTSEYNHLSYTPVCENNQNNSE